ncbi:alpha/beta hydrolase [Frankia sp. CcI49]|nr:alpha/beta hydrolase [Frankia sp. CcI49]
MDESRLAVLRSRLAEDLNVIWVSGLLAALSMVLAVGTFAWQAPGIGLVGSLGGYVPGWLLVMSSAGAAAGIGAWLLNPSVVALIMIAFCVLSAAAGVKVIVDQRRQLKSFGVRSSAKDYFGRLSWSKNGPDDIVTYGPVDGHSPRMAVYMPRTSVAAAPVVVHIHGGGWTAGSETIDTAFARHLTDRGFLVFAPTYTLATESFPTWELAPRQIACALATARKMSEKYGGSSRHFYVTGGSAGGNLAPLVVNRIARGESFGHEGEMPVIKAVAVSIPAVDPGFAEGNPFAISGTLARHFAQRYTGGTPEEFPERYAAVSATNFVSQASPPTLLVYGPNDWLVPSQGILTYAQHARAMGAAVSAVPVPWTGHLIGLSGAGSKAIIELTVNWFEAHSGIGETEEKKAHDELADVAATAQDSLG